ncbi:hypothetical protein ASE01_14605 [Nocardioides sp. Root190]|uniref:hypothetical protein n=1 Tax=Nocardioides sp. Root190 TaxID=1736488 RepID=UPI0007021ACA|nr:hypothetical protein [Nocardioides sp. Root190]KRB76238.1 hypothetical protein ASE01_14605 [Nocardioides sp. Root190]
MPRTLLTTRSHRPLIAGSAVAACGLLLAACGGEDVGAKPDLPTEPPALWNPCDALSTDFVKKEFGATTTKNTGSLTAPDCRFAPAAGSGEPALTANYQLFSGTLDDFWKQMGQTEDADVRTPEVPGADDARIVVAAEKDQLYVTGFVQNGALFEVVNVVDPAPYDVELAVRGTEATLAALSAHADDNSAGDPAATPTG